MNEKARIAAIKAGSQPTLNDWLEAAFRPRLLKALERSERPLPEELTDAFKAKRAGN